MAFRNFELIGPADALPEYITLADGGRVEIRCSGRPVATAA